VISVSDAEQPSVEALVEVLVVARDRNFSNEYLGIVVRAKLAALDSLTAALGECNENLQAAHRTVLIQRDALDEITRDDPAALERAERDLKMCVAYDEPPTGEGGVT
jgi:hypothetical protein